MTSLAQASEAEVTQLHRFFVDWMTGKLATGADAFARVEQALGEDFFIVSPRGDSSERAPLLARLQEAHAARPDFTIWIENFRARRELGELCLVTYEEWQREKGRTTGRLSTALFRAKPDAPNGVEWLHVHETWLPGQGP